MQSNLDNADLDHASGASRIRAMLEDGTFQDVRRSIRALSPVEIARLLASLPPPSRNIVWNLVDKDYAGEVLEELPYDIQSQFLQDMDTEDVLELTEGLDADDIVDILQNLPDKVTAEVLRAMSDTDRQRVEAILTYEEDTAGGLTDPDVITVRPRISLDVVLRYLRRHPELPHTTDALFVVNKRDEYLGILPLAKIVTTDPSVTVRELMITDIEPIPVTLHEREVVKLFEQNDWVTAPVVDAQGKLIGRITIDDVVDVIREHADHSMMNLAGLGDEEDTFATMRRAFPRRAIWLGINLITAFIASAVVSLFEDTLDQVVALAVLMPIVASMGGVAGSQTLTVVIRGMSLGHIDKKNLAWLITREFWLGLTNGGLWALVVAVIAGFWFQSPIIAAIIAAAMVINLLTAALAGALLPVFLKSCRIDPALAGGVTLTTFTDVVGFFAFLGLATVFLG